MVVARLNSALILRSRESGVSKDDPEGPVASFETRAAPAPQDEGCGNGQGNIGRRPC